MSIDDSHQQEIRLQDALEKRKLDTSFSYRRAAQVGYELAILEADSRTEVQSSVCKKLAEDNDLINNMFADRGCLYSSEQNSFVYNLKEISKILHAKVKKL